MISCYDIKKKKQQNTTNSRKFEQDSNECEKFMTKHDLIPRVAKDGSLWQARDKNENNNVLLFLSLSYTTVFL